MPGPDTAVEEAPVLVALYLTLYFALAWIVLRGLRVTWQYSVGWLLAQLGKLPKIGTWPVKVDLGKPFRKLEADILNALDSQAKTYENQMGRWFHAAARIQLWIADELYAMAKDVLHWASWLQKTHLPKWLKGALDSLALGSLVYKIVHDYFGKQIGHLRKIVVGVVSEAIHHVIPGWLHGALGAVYWLKDHWKTLAKVLAFAATLPLLPGLAIPRLWRSIHDLRKWRTNVNRRLSKLEGVAAAGVFAALLANTLGVTMRCVRSGNVGKAARRLCGLDNLVMDALLADLAFVAGTISIVEFAKALQKAAPLVATSLVYVVDEIPIAVDDAEAIGKRALKILDSVA